MLARSRLFKLGAGLAGLGVLGFAAYRYFAKPAGPAAPAYTVTQVARGDLTRAVLTTGQLTPLVSVEISTQISGLITEVAVDFNSPVKKGQLLARIDPATYEQKVNQAKADLAAAEANHHLAQLTADRDKELLGRALIPQSDYDRDTAQLEQAQATLLTRKAAVENAQLDLDRCTLVSPIDGIVIFKAADVGKTVQASYSAPTLFVIAQDLRRLQIIAPVSEVDIWSVKAGQDITFSIEALPDRTFHGTLKQIRNPYTPSDQKGQGNSAASPITKFDAVIEVDNPDLTLLPSLTANVSIIIAQRAHVLEIPNSCLRVRLPGSAAPNADDSDTATVYRLSGGNRSAPPEAVAVTLGVTDSINTEAVSGVNEGDTLITGIARAPVVRGPRLF